MRIMCSKVVGKEQNYTTWYRQLYSLHKTEGIYVEIAEDIEARFYTLNYELDRSLLKGKTKKVIELLKYGLGGKIMN